MRGFRKGAFISLLLVAGRNSLLCGACQKVVMVKMTGTSISHKATITWHIMRLFTQVQSGMFLVDVRALQPFPLLGYNLSKG